MAESEPTSTPENPETEPTPQTAPVVSQCPECQGVVDVTLISPYTKIECPHCSQPFRVRTRLGNYEITRMLGEGGMSQVFLANDVTLNRPVALKILHQKLSEDAALTAMFEREAKLTASMNHPNVVKVYTASSHEGYFYIAMELVDNVSIEQMIAVQGPIREARVLDIAHDVTNGLKAAFKAGLIHRDIKPGNMLVTSAGIAKLVDFGLALHQDGEEDIDDLWATPFYVPPEKLDGDPDTYLGDIYSLGATFFHALAGKPPFEANTSSLEELKAIKKQSISLSEMAPTVTKPVIDLVEKMMAYKPADRPQSYNDLLDLIEKTMDHVPGTTKKRAVRTTEKAGGPAFSSGAMKGIIGGAVALIIGVIVIIAVVSGGKKDGEIDNSLIIAEENVIGNEGITAQFNAGRTALIAGDFLAAEKTFTELIDSKKIEQPTLGWLHYNQSLLFLLRGDEVNAREHFQQLKRPSLFPEDASGSLLAQQQFFKKTGTACMGQFPVLDETAATFSATTGYEQLGLLACGLKNWSHGEFKSAGVMLEQFAKAPAAAETEWAAGFRPVVQKYIDDAALLKSLPRPVGSTTSGDLKGMAQALTKAIPQLKTKGPALDFVNARLKRCTEYEAFHAKSRELEKLALAPRPVLKKRPKRPAPPPLENDKPAPSEPLTEADAEELATLATAIESASSLAAGYSFSAAVLKVESVTINQSPVKQLHADVLETYQHADAFIERFIAEISLNDYEGIVRRKEGVPLDAKITAATRDSLTVNLGFGDNLIEIAKFDPDWIREAAETTFLTTEANPPDSEAKLWEQAACFALVSGMPAHAMRFASEARPLDSAFDQQWSRMTDAKLLGLDASPPEPAIDESAEN